MTADDAEQGTQSAQPESPRSRLEVLADLQDLDVRLAQIDHRVERLPERQTHAEIEAELAEIAAQARALDARISGLERQQRRHEDDVAGIEAKRAQNAERLYDSHLTSPKEAEALTAEAGALERRQTEVEDEILELMEQLEPLTAERADFGARHAEAAERLSGVAVAIAAAEAEASAERGGVQAERAARAASADPELVSLYERRRAAARGAPVVGRLVGAVCGACHLEIASVEYERIRCLDPDELAECPECGALLVR